ncbi:MAG: hypothetical protein ACYCOY_07590 [Metallibacterium sp.]|nr:hypothetical protein [Metallibacterium sp.]
MGKPHVDGRAPDCFPLCGLERRKRERHVSPITRGEQCENVADTK